MIPPSGDDRPIAASGGWRLVADGLGTVGYVVLLLLAYFRLPPVALQISNAWDAVVLTFAALAVLGWLYFGRLRRVPTADRPLARAIRMVVVLLSTFVVLFSYAYLSLEARLPGQVPGLLTHLDALYFTVTMLTTVGFGDISPAGQAARAVATLQMVVNVVLLGLLVRVAIDVGRRTAQQRRQAGAQSSGGGG